MGKGSNTTTQQTMGVGSTAADPRAQAAYMDVLQRAAGVANSPYQSYSGQLVAPVNAQQNLGIGNINAAAGSALPYIGQAAGLASAAGQPITQQQIQGYLSPYTQNVVNATQAQFADQNAQQQAGLKGNAISQGALGGNRLGVAQGVLAGQQQLAQAPVIANLYNQGYGQAVQTAENQQQAGLAAAYGLSGIGQAYQNAGLSGANAQLGAGTLEQQTQQAQNTAAYGQFQQQQAFPYQQAQWLAGLDTAVAPGLGQTSTSTSTGQTTTPPPNPWTQIAGLGIAGAGLFLNRGGVVHRDYGGGVGSFPYGASGMPYAGVQGYIPTMQISPVHLQAPSVSASAPKPYTDTSGADLTKQVAGFAQQAQKSPGDWFSGPSYGGGNVLTDAWGGSSAEPLAGLSKDDYGEGYARGGGVAGLADGGDPSTIEDRFAPVAEAIASGDFDPQGANETDFRGQPGLVASNRGAVPLPMARPASAPARGGASDDDDEDALPAAATPTAGLAGPAQPYSINDPHAGFSPTTSSSPASAPAPAAPERNFLGLERLSPNVRQGLLAAGLGMLASRSPFLGTGIGEGGLAGLNAYNSAQAAQAKAEQDTIRQRQEERRIDFEAQRLAQSARQQQFTEASAPLIPGANGQMQVNPAYIAKLRAEDEAKSYKPTWGVIGETTDPASGTMRKQYGWIDANNKAITDSQGKPIDMSASSTPPGPAPGSTSPDGKPLTGEDFIATLPPQRAQSAKMMGNYEENPADLPTRGGVRAAMVADAKRYNPDYDERMYYASQQALKNFRAGTDSRTIGSLNVATDHLETLRQAALALQNGNIPMLNRLVNYYREQTGSPLTTNFDSIKQAVSSEIAKVVVGGQTALQDRDEMSNRAANYNSPDQLLGIFDQFNKLMGGQMKGLKKRYETNTFRKDFDDQLLPTTKKALAAVSKDTPDTYNPAEEAPLETKVINGKTYVGRRGGEWREQ